MRRAALPFVLAMLAGPALAEPWACAFTVECEASAGCSDAGLTVEVIAADHAGDLVLSSVTGVTPVTRLTPADRMPATYAGTGRIEVAELLTIDAGRTALMTLHIFDGAAAAITYFGTCEELT